MDKLLEMLGVEKIDENAQDKIKEHLDTLVEVKAKEFSKSTLDEEKENLIKTYEDKFEDYKEDITSKFSNFVDSILDEEMTIPEKVLEFAKKGELYHDLIEQFKIRLSVDEGLLDEEVKGLLQEAKDEIINLRSDLDEKISKELELERDAQKLASALYLRTKTDGLTESQKTHVFEILEGETDKEVIDRKFTIIVENIKTVDEKEKKEDEDDEEDEDKKKKKDEDEKKGKGKTEVEDDEEDEDKKKKKDESNGSPFEEWKKGYVKILKENKI